MIAYCIKVADALRRYLPNCVKRVDIVFAYVCQLRLFLWLAPYLNISFAMIIPPPDAVHDTALYAQRLQDPLARPVP